jgi:hypothetical protein
MPSAPAPGTWLLIVQRARPAVYRRLRQSFADDHGVEVLLDRRRADRRALEGSRVPERRRDDRRHPLPATEVAFGRGAGFVLVARP